MPLEYQQTIKVSSRSEFASNTSQLSSSENENSETDKMECSDNEQTPSSIQNTEVSESSVWKHFD